MKRLFTMVLTATLALFTGSSLLAGGVENKHNLSAEYIRTLNRNAATDSADAVAYNPAGVMKMEDGFYMNLSGQYAIKEYCNSFGGTDYEDDTPNIIPSFFSLYKKEKWAAFGAFTIVSGGGKVEFDNGSATTLALGQRLIATSGGRFNAIKAHRLEGDSYYSGFTLGGAYAVNDWVSFSLGLRYVDARKSRKGYAILSGTGSDRIYEVDYEETADGWGGIIGINVSPGKNFNIGLRLETRTRLELETRVNKDDMGLLQDGSKTRRDMPALLGFGISYRLRPDLKIDLNLTQYQNGSAHWDDIAISLGNESRKTHGYELGFALEYAFTDRLRGSLGTMYSETGLEPDNMSVETPELDAVTLAAGFVFEARPGMDLNFGVMRSYYSDEVTTSGIGYRKDVLIIGLGIQYRFF